MTEKIEDSVPPAYTVAFAGEALKDLRKLGPSAATEILRQIKKKLTTRPTEYGDPLVRDLGGYYKLRVGEFRVVYRVIDTRVLVIVLAAGKRAEGDLMERLNAFCRENGIQVELKL